MKSTYFQIQISISRGFNLILISDLLNSGFIKISFRFFKSWVLISDLRLSNWFNQRFPVQNFQISDFQILFLDEIQIPNFYSKAA
jgi:hypothetical protein